MSDASMEIPNSSDCYHAFVAYLDKQGLDPAVEVCPCDGGELTGVTGHAFDYIDDFLEAHPQFTQKEAEVAADEIGDVSSLFRDQPEDFSEPDESDEPEEE